MLQSITNIRCVKIFNKIISLLVTLILVFSCGGIKVVGGSRTAVITWGQVQGFTAGEVTAGQFNLLRLIRQKVLNNSIITVYIEGDGAAWQSIWQPPPDPTPQYSVALALAATDPAATVIYFGRPCQYLSPTQLATCSPDYWQHRRFATEVIDAYEEALNTVKMMTNAVQLRLIGYSGGGVVATLLASRRSDVNMLITIAAPLALSTWTHWHRISPLIGSLDPININLSTKLPYHIHLVGERDKVVPKEILSNFIDKHGGQLIVVPGFRHECCWADNWPQLLNQLQN